MKKVWLFLLLVASSTAFAEENIAEENTFLKEYVIKNPDIRTALKECPTYRTLEPCVLYMRNTSDKDQIAEDFFDEAAKKAGRAPYLIRIENMHYAKTIIPKGSVAEIKIPPLR